jgi:alanyl-tRNA synthetase
MTERLYYHDSFLCQFDAQVVDVLAVGDRPALVLDRTAFYPTSGGQPFDTGWIASARDGSEKIRVAEVTERDDGAILHMVEGANPFASGARVQGAIDVDRRRDHMQQHSGQHVLSAAFIRLFGMATVSFHMGADYCSIDLDTKTLAREQVEAAEGLANEIVMENRSVEIRFATPEEARQLGLRKMPQHERDKLRLIDMTDFDLTACGGTHVSGTGQIGAILLRKAEKVRQGWRVEFVCGRRAIATARRDFRTLTDCAGLLSGHIWEVPEQIRKTQEEARAARKSGEEILGELAELQASRLLAETAEKNGRKVVARIFPDRNLAFVKLLAHQLVRQGSSAVAFLASTAEPPALVFVQSAGQPFHMGELIQEALAKLGGRGGGSKDMAQGGPVTVDELPQVLTEIARRASWEMPVASP